ncbi:MAG TPA: hypothetical protein ENG33_03200 [Chloroflexi bacterium]|nr:hypothetical protein [Chloroflexota bacterium]
MGGEFLTPLQEEFLRRFFATRAGQRFFLTGGTALAAFYFHHRISVDLDLFTVDDLALRESDPVVSRILADLNCRLIRTRTSEHFRQYIAEGEKGQGLHVDLVRDFGPQFGEKKAFEGIIVDSVENIGANKITAILGRTDAKDFVDLYFILKAGYDFDDLFAKAQQKDLGLHPFHFAGALLQVQKLKRLPEMKKPLTLEELQQTFVELANRILDELNPQ